ncbi:phosphoglycerate dehydrogenase [Sinanaerobacter chloroacetimidivorans]|uniref:Phosphoglycerate dehydrogenase n=1 Tax=Sinanaerobacter chloroacetimidivorans TaxID=2818044 RepID=A0A8J7VZ84_9FIRM|nr:phosphoglycerate dehydrogenase [Sinanaerobacter chloroacetimidivorans]MBR0597872.1 phosphoglycerate dehydrogenase [Sinanaerobacter chloroacetimidivorans]
MKKILITSKSFGQVSDQPLKLLNEAGMNIEYYNKEFDEMEFRKRLKECSGLIIGSHPLTEGAVKEAPELRIVCKHGTGLDNIDLEIMERYKVKVDNVPAVNSNAVADLAFSLILDVARKTSCAAKSVKEGSWEKVFGVNVYSKNLSLIGFGEIGKNVARRAHGFSMKVFVYDPFLSVLPEEFKDYVKPVSLEEALSVADFLSVHVPLNHQTQNLICLKELNMMKRGSFIINTSRGGIINETDLLAALLSKHIAGAGLDVLEKEPPNKDYPLLKLQQVTITPHMGMYSFESINDVSMIAARNIIKYLSQNE